MNALENYQLAMRILGTAAIVVQAYVFGPSIGLGITHGIMAYCIWFNRERTK